LEINDLIQVYPNPVSEILTITNLQNTTVKVFIYNSIGQNLSTFSFSETKQIDTSKLESGIYQLLICDQNGRKIHNTSFIKN
jgi:hypothetical protein